MKHLFSFLLILLISSASYAQVIADPAHNQIDVTTLASGNQDPAALPLDGLIFLRVPILNLNQVNAIPSGTCKIKIGLGSKLVLDPAFNLASTNTSAYFNWTAADAGGQMQITGDLINPLPANFSAVCIFSVKGSLQGSSTITTNFLVTNHNTSVFLSDENPTNNTSFLPYTVVPVIPVTFISMAVKKEACAIKVNFATENEINTERYEIEASKDGSRYQKMGSLPANHAINYAFSFELNDALKNQVLYIRVKSVDKDGKFQYSETKNIKGTCDKQGRIGLFPNPLFNNQSELNIRMQDNAFNGAVSVLLTDIAGKKISKRDLTLINQQQFSYQTGQLAAGQYLLHVSLNNETPVILKFQKL